MDPTSPVQVMFVPSYLNGVGRDLRQGLLRTALRHGHRPYSLPDYEPWGYTPLESVAFSVPTITTSLAGFGLWVAEHCKEHKGVEVIDRNDANDSEVVTEIASSIEKFCNMSAKEYASYQESALKTSEIALWENLYAYYDARLLRRARQDDRAQFRDCKYEGGGDQTTNRSTSSASNSSATARPGLG